VQNPVDMLASASPSQYADCLKILLRDENVDGVMVILPPPPMFKAEDVAEKIVESVFAQGSSSEGKPVVITLLGSTLIEKAVQVFLRAHIPIYSFPERAASAMSAVFKRAEFLDAETQSHGEINKTSPGVSATNPAELLAAYGIPTAPVKLARNLDEATNFAHELGFPVVMKIASPDILHKSDVGGVLVDVRDVSFLQNGYAQLLERVKFARPEARIEGIHIQRQIPQGQEVIVGMTRDPQFGPLMMFGSGGVEVEGLKDVAFALAPLNQAEVREMMRRTWAGRKLKGFRHLPPADEEAVLDVLTKLSRLAVENENIAEIEINPLRVLERGAVALDVRISLAQKD